PGRTAEAGRSASARRRAGCSLRVRYSRRHVGARIRRRRPHAHDLYICTEPFSGKLRELPPTRMRYWPGVTVQLWLATSQWLNDRAFNAMLTCPVWPGVSRIFWNPCNSSGASTREEDDGDPTYTSAISAPVFVPVLVTSASTVTAPPVPFVIFKLAYE